MLIATKCGSRSGEAITSAGASYRHVLHSIEMSLRRLGTDFIDLFQLHKPDPFTPHEETGRALEDAVRKGWVRYVGYCNYPAWEAQNFLNRQRETGRPSFISAQMYYSLLGRDLENEVAPFLTANKLGLLVWSPLASGFLSGKYTRANPVPAESRRAKFDFPPINVETGYRVVEILSQIAAEKTASVAQVALAWLLHKPFVSSVIIGASKQSQLEDNLKSINLKLTPSEMKVLNEASAIPIPYPGWMQPMFADAKVAEGLAGVDS